jgi:hypothetical protein
LLSSAAGAVPNLSLQIIWHKPLRKSSCSSSYVLIGFSYSILYILCQIYHIEFTPSIIFLCPSSPFQKLTFFFFFEIRVSLFGLALSPQSSCLCL